MAKPILIVRVPCAKIDNLETYEEFRYRVKESCPDYNVLVFIDDIKAEIITERNQPQGLSV